MFNANGFNGLNATEPLKYSENTYQILCSIPKKTIQLQLWMALMDPKDSFRYNLELNVSSAFRQGAAYCSTQFGFAYLKNYVA